MEPVRLVVWDLDETFWSGTLTEGGISYSDENHRIVIELARRGIMSSLCSKNDLEPVKQILEKTGIWDYFIFPSLDWTPKGARLKDLIEAVQLRPESVLFIDDNPLNRGEACQFAPGIQVADETFIPGLLENPLLQGKADPDLSRLKNYKVLEEKHEAKSSSTDITQFLRDSHIQVTIEHNIADHMERVVELINRTNQLNFTKRRLPENFDEACEQLRGPLRDIFHHAGLIHVKDRYGDYGFVGFYLLHRYGNGHYLEHFCFSCRTIGMGIEKWVYDKLGRPDIHVVAPVLSDIHSDQEIDWINQSHGYSESNEKIIKKAIIRGGCAISSLGHYLELYADETVSEHNYIRDGMGVRIDHSSLLSLSLFGTERDKLIAQDIGYCEEDLQSSIGKTENIDIYILNFVDGLYSTYATEDSLRLPPFEVRSLNIDDFRHPNHKDENQSIQKMFCELQS